MSSKSHLNPILLAFAIAIVRPWRHRQRFKILMLGATGGLSLSILSFSIQYHIAQLGIIRTVVYLALVVLLPGFLGIATSYFCMSIGCGRVAIAVMQSVGLFLILRWPSVASASALATMLLQAPFWAGYHMGFAIHRSHDNHGPETALSSLIFLWSGGAGTVIGGWLLQKEFYLGALVGGAILLMVSTQMLYMRVRTEPFFRVGWKYAVRRKVSAHISRLNGAVSAASDYSMAAWMLAIGMSPLIGGIMLAVRPVLGFFLTPLVGRLIHKKGPQALFAGGIFLMIAWAEIGCASLLTKSALAVVPGFVLLAVGANLIGPAEAGRWYKMRSAPGIVAREASLTMGRLPALALLVPLVYLAPQIYPFVACGLASLLVLRDSKKVILKPLRFMLVNRDKAVWPDLPI